MPKLNTLIKFIQAGVVFATEKDLALFDPNNPKNTTENQCFNIFIRNEGGYRCDESSDDLEKLSLLIKENSNHSPWLIYGSLSSHTLSSLLENSKQHLDGVGDNSCKIYLLDPAIHNVACILDNNIVLKALKDGRLLIFTGINMIEHLNSVVSHCSFYPTPFHFLIATNFNKAIIQNLILNISKIIDNKKDIHDKLTESNRIFYENYHFDLNKPSLNILFITSIQTTFLNKCTEEISHGFKKLGHQIHILRQPTFHDTLSLASFSEVLQHFKPDMVFQIDYFKHQIGDLIPEKMPFISWIQDLTKEAMNYDSNNIHENNFIFFLVKEWADKFSIYPKYRNKKLFFSPCGVTIPKLQHKERQPIDISYVSHLNNYQRTLFPIKNNFNFKEYTEIEILYFLQHNSDLKKLNNTYLECLELIESYSFLDYLSKRKEVVEKCIDIFIKNNFVDEHKLKHYFIELHNRITDHLNLLLKVKPIERLVEEGLNIKVYGSNWNKFKQFSSAANRPICNKEALNRITANSKISLNISPGMTLHVRALEIMSCKSFLLSRKFNEDQSPLSLYFQEGRDIVLFQDLDDLCKKANFYIQNPEQREFYINNAYRIVQEHFQNESIAKEMLSKVRNA